MSNIDKRALREAAEKAGSDKWQAKKINGDFYVIRNGSYEKQHGFTSYQPIAEIEHKPVRDFVAAANPATVLALLDELEGEAGRIKELESQRQLAFTASNRWAEKFREAENRNAEQADIIAKQEKWIKDVEATMISATDRAEAAEKRIELLTSKLNALGGGGV